MSVPRYLFTATLLHNGKVLVAGGQNNHARRLSSAELFDPSSNSWSAVASMLHARVAQTATLLKDGDVLLAGGAVTKTAELFDPQNNTWHDAGTMLSARVRANATLLKDGDVLVSGGLGVSDSTPAPEFYDPSTNSWRAAGRQLSPISRGGTTALSTGEVLVAGGYNSSIQGDAGYSSVATSELYVPATNSWRAAGSMTTPRASQIMQPLLNGGVLAAGGVSGGYPTKLVASAEIYNPSTNTWSATASMSAPRAGATSVTLPSGKVFVAGGFREVEQNGNPSAPPLASAEIYNPRSGTWSATLDMSTGREGPNPCCCKTVMCWWPAVSP